MKKLEEIKLEENTLLAEKSIKAQEKKTKIFKKAFFEVVSVILIIALFFYENGELIVKEQGFFIFLGNIAVMFILSMLFDNNYRIKGKLVGFSSPKYRSAATELKEITKDIKDNDIEILNTKLTEYIENKERRDIQDVLYKVGITKEDYDKKYKFLSDSELKENLTKLQIRGIKKARKVRKIKISAAELLSDVSVNGEFLSLGKSVKALDREHSIKSVATYLITAAVFSYFAVTLTKDFTLASFGWFMLKVCFLVFRGIKSYFESYIEVVEKLSARLNAQKTLIVYFLRNESPILQTTQLAPQPVLAENT